MGILASPFLLGAKRGRCWVYNMIIGWMVAFISLSGEDGRGGQSIW